MLHKTEASPACNRGSIYLYLNTCQLRCHKEGTQSIYIWGRVVDCWECYCTMRPRHGHLVRICRHGHLDRVCRHGHLDRVCRHGHLDRVCRHGHLDRVCRHGHLDRVCRHGHLDRVCRHGHLDRVCRHGHLDRVCRHGHLDKVCKNGHQAWQVCKNGHKAGHSLHKLPPTREESVEMATYMNRICNTTVTAAYITPINVFSVFPAETDHSPLAFDTST